LNKNRIEIIFVVKITKFRIFTVQCAVDRLQWLPSYFLDIQCCV